MKNKVILLVATLGVLITGCNIKYESNIETDENNEIVNNADIIIDFCYTDEAYKSYFEFCEKEFEKQNEKVDIVLHCKKENSEYLDSIADATYTEDTFMDVYMISDSNIGTAYLAGVAAKNEYDVFSNENYCDTALNASSFGNSLVAYPLSYDTTFFLYRSDVLKKEDVSSFYSLMGYSDNADFSSEELMTVETIFKCDTNDIFNIYGFIGGGVNLGGDTGSDATIVDINNGITQRLAVEYVAFLQYFSSGMSEKQDVILDKFLEGKCLSTIVSTYDLQKIVSSELVYSIKEVPDYIDMMEIEPLCITQCVAVNVYSPNNDIASDFARFVTYEGAPYLYDMSGKLSARKNVTYENAQIGNIYNSYEKGCIKNKLQYGEQFYPLMEIALHNIAAGNEIETELLYVQEHMEAQLK